MAMATENHRHRERLLPASEKKGANSKGIMPKGRKEGRRSGGRPSLNSLKLSLTHVMALMLFQPQDTGSFYNKSCDACGTDVQQGLKGNICHRV